MNARQAIDRLSELAGLVTSYRDAWGNTRRMSDDTKLALLAALGIDAGSTDAVTEAIRNFEEGPWRRPLERVLSIQQPHDQRLRIPLTLPAREEDRMVEWRLEKETGESQDGKTRFEDLPLLESRRLDGDVFERRALEIPHSASLGYHRLRILGFGGDPPGSHGEHAECCVIVFPKQCHLLRRSDGQGRAWGIDVQLYSLRSSRNWGIGDFGDLARLIAMAARLDADTVALNPLHALFPANPERISPYSPSDRRFLSMLYIDVEAVADFAECEAAKDMLGNAEMRARLAAARDTELVDYAAVAASKLQALELLYQSFFERHMGGGRSTAVSERGAAFRRFQLVGGQAFERLGIFQALSEHFGPDLPWQDWPEPYRDCDSREVESFAADHRVRVEFYQYLQWVADQQLGSAMHTARDAGMTIGLYHDLPLAADRAGAETWMNRRFIARGVSLGAPPDEWNHHGQNWGLAAYNPHALHAAAYAPFRATLQASMAHGGALRIDHAMSLERTYWIPRGAEPQDGGYIRWPVTDMLGILALESERQKCVVVGEDLGTLPEGFADRLHEAGVLSYRLLYFNQDERGEFAPPQNYPASALVAVGTHDLATLPGFWRGRDLDVRAELGLYPSREMESSARERRAQECIHLIKAFKQEGVLPASFPDDPDEFSFDLAQAAYRFLARSPAILLLLHLEDALGQEQQVNVPGTSAEYPNWRHKMPLDIDELEHDPRIIALAGAIRDERRAQKRTRRGSGNGGA